MKKHNDTIEYYIRDAQGNTMSIYREKHDSITLEEQDLYGSSRLGTRLPEELLKTGMAWGGIEDTGYIALTRGLKQYELTNHLGNVLATISDRRLQRGGDTLNVKYYLADVTSSQDYYAFGSMLQGRSWGLVQNQPVYKDTCVVCRALKNFLAGLYPYSLSTAIPFYDTAVLASQLNTQFKVCQPWSYWKTAIYTTCGLWDSIATFTSPNPGDIAGIDYGHRPDYLIGTSDFTVEAWIWRSSGAGSTTPTILSKYHLNSFTGEIGGFILSLNATAQLQFTVGDAFSGAPPNYQASVTSTHHIGTGTWVHVAAVRVGNDPNNWRLYINGALATSTVTGMMLPPPGDIDQSLSDHLEVGMANILNPWMGRIDRARLYTSALSSADILNTYNSGCGIPSAMLTAEFDAPLFGSFATTPVTTNELVYDQTGTVNSGGLGTVSWPLYWNDTNCINDTTSFGCHTVLVSTSKSITHDTCITCEGLSNAMTSYTGSSSDTSAIAAYLNSTFGFSMTEDQYKTAFHKCNQTKDTLYLNGSSRYVDYGNNSQYKVGTGNFTIEAWVNSTLGGTGQAVLSNGLSRTSPSRLDGIIITFAATGLNVVLGDGRYNDSINDEEIIDATAVMSLSLNTWHNLVIERTGTGRSYTDLKVWVDGVSRTLTPAGANCYLATANIDSSVSPMKVGSRTGAWVDNDFKGSIREARMYKRLLDTAEIRKDYNSGCATDPFETANLVLWAPINDGSGTTCADESHYHATGTIEGSGSGYWGASSTYYYTNRQVLCGTTTKNLMTWARGGYRYGFNGKERIDEVYGNGNFYDYKNRMYLSQLGRFASVDMMTGKYPMLTPFQFASNTPIDGIDLDGLECATFNIYVQNNTVTAITVSKDYELKNKTSQGPGIQHNYKYQDGKGNTTKTDTKFISNLYGIYQGSDNPQLPTIGKSPDKVKDDYSLPPIDEADANAKQHDLDYDKQGISGISGVMDPKSSEANNDYFKRADIITDKYKNGGKDAITGKPVTKAANDAATSGKFYLKLAEDLKKPVIDEGVKNPITPATK